MLVPCMFMNYDSYIVLSVTTAQLQLVNGARNTKLPDRGRYAAGTEEMANPESSIKVETCELFNPI